MLPPCVLCLFYTGSSSSCHPFIKFEIECFTQLCEESDKTVRSLHCVADAGATTGANGDQHALWSNAIVTDVEPTTETGGDQHTLWSNVIMINAGTITEANDDQPALSSGAIVTDVRAVAEASCD